MAGNYLLNPTYGAYGEDTSVPSFHSRRLGIDRAAVDYSTTVVPLLTSSIYESPSRNKEIRRNYAPWARQILPISACPPWGNESVCSFLASSSLNKSRSPCTLIKWFPDGRKLLSGTAVGELAVWNGIHFNFEDIKRLPLGGGAVTALEFSPEGDRLYAGDISGQVMVLSLALNPLENQAFEGLNHQIRDLSLSPFGNKLAACANACNPIIWDVATRDIERYLRAQHFDTNSTVCLKWHPDKALVGTCSGMNWLYLWDPRTSEPVASVQAHNRSLISLQWNPDGRSFLTSGKDTLIKLWDLRYLKMVELFRCMELSSVPDGLNSSGNSNSKGAEPLCVEWNPVQNHIFVVGDSCGGLSYWSTFHKDKPLCYIRRAHGGYQRSEKDVQMLSLNWHPMGHLLTTSSNDRHIRFWARGPPGCVIGEVMDAYGLCDIEKAGNFPMSRDYSQIAPIKGQTPNYSITSLPVSRNIHASITQPHRLAPPQPPHTSAKKSTFPTFTELHNSWISQCKESSNEFYMDSWLDGLPKPKRSKSNSVTGPTS